MTVKEFSDVIGIPASKIRYYDRSSLIEGKRETENNYRCFSKYDALAIYNAQMLRSFDFGINDVLAAQNENLLQLNNRVSNTIDSLEKSIREQEIRLVRFKEMKRYLEIMDNYRSKVSFHKMQASYNIWTINTQPAEYEKNAVKTLAEVMPFSYICIRIKKESVFKAQELQDFCMPLDVSLGLGILESNMKKIGISFPESIKKYEEHNALRMLIETEDPFALCAKDILPLLEELDKRKLSLQEDIIGRIFISYKKDGNIIHGIGMGYEIPDA